MSSNKNGESSQAFVSKVVRVATEKAGSTHENIVKVLNSKNQDSTLTLEESKRTVKKIVTISDPDSPLTVAAKSFPQSDLKEQDTCSGESYNTVSCRCESAESKVNMAISDTAPATTEGETDVVEASNGMANGKALEILGKNEDTILEKQDGNTHAADDLNGHQKRKKEKVIKQHIATLAQTMAESQDSETVSKTCAKIGQALKKALYYSLVEKQIRETVSEIHREHKLGHTWYDDKAVTRSKLDRVDIYHNTELLVSSLVCVCPNCGRVIGAGRFAPHLDKCKQRSSRERTKRPDSAEPDHAVVPKRRKQPKKNSRRSKKASKKAPNIIPCWDCGKDEEEPTVICDGCDRMYHSNCFLGPKAKDSMQLQFDFSPPICFCTNCLPNLELVVNAPKYRKRKRNISNSEATMTKLKNGRAPAPYSVLEFYCDICNEAIINSRWRCLECNNFDSCIDCFREKKVSEIQNQHQCSHHMVKIKIQKTGNH
mmetsp:Transcript_9949/g.13006  ORF Transcript_9949/g.13006 Transcript_9949/m.13006 type:complete len:485 (+) Transcript_9949:138-1592(+)